jgi:hypothetical protein
MKLPYPFLYAYRLSCQDIPVFFSCGGCFRACRANKQGLCFPCLPSSGHTLPETRNYPCHCCWTKVWPRGLIQSSQGWGWSSYPLDRLGKQPPKRGISLMKWWNMAPQSKYTSSLLLLSQSKEHQHKHKDLKKTKQGGRYNRELFW